MAAIARWCLRHRLVVVLLWLLALGGTAAGATFAGSAYSNDYEVPGTESGRATALLDRGFHGLGGDSDTIVWHTDRGSVRADAVEQRMEAMLDKVADLPGVAAVTSPYGDARGQVSEDGHTAYATVTFDAQADDIPEAQARALFDTAQATPSTTSRSNSAAAPSPSPRPPAGTSPKSSASPSRPWSSSSPSARSPPPRSPSRPRSSASASRTPGSCSSAI
ncbi:hypothetical protein STANM309S_02644 [Streptomyces tanashiensis]